MRLTLREYCELCKHYRVRTRGLSVPGHPPVHYARVESRSDNQLIAYMWFDGGREEWVMFDPDSATDEVIRLLG